METLTREVARSIIEFVGSSGTPPEYGFQFFTAGLDEYLDPIEAEYLSSFVKDGGSSFKMVVGSYGGGKTHFLFCVRERAWKHNFAVSYVRLTPTETPFHKLESVYQSIVTNLTYPLTGEELLSGYERGIESFIKAWYAQVLNQFRRRGVTGDRLEEELNTYISSMPNCDSISFTNAVKEAFRCLLDRRDSDFSRIAQWLKAEGFDRRADGHLRFGILQRIDKGTAFPMIRSLVRWVREVGYSGLVVLFDEAEVVPSMSGKQKDLLLSNLRELIDECGHGTLDHSMFFYAVPDENFLQGRTQIYEALRQRVSTVFETINPVGVKIYLEKLSSKPEEVLREIGSKLAEIFEIAYQIKFETGVLMQSIGNIADAAYAERFGDIGYKRLFVQAVIKGFQVLRNDPTAIISLEKAKELLHGHGDR
ncbi:MAG TPA: BREX system ATP-binding domain-containing protein [Dehalococcoidia bacterium]|nr:BREX system ATP-binding domain-containing protein [Dehalococcoidia bacterium]